MPRFSANLGFLWNELPFMDRFGAAAAVGFDAVEYMFPYAFEPDALRERLRDHGLHQDLFNLPAGDFDAGERGIAGDPSRRDEFAEGVERALRYAGVLGCRKLNCLAGLRLPALRWQDQFDCLIENLAFAAQRLGAGGCRMHLELLNPRETPGFFVDSIEMVARVLDAVGSPHLLFQCDVYHLQRTSGDLVETISGFADRTGHYQIADAPSRHEPGTGEIAYPFVLDAIDATGYEGFVGLEYRPSGDTDGSFGWIERYGYTLGSRREVAG